MQPMGLLRGENKAEMIDTLFATKGGLEGVRRAILANSGASAAGISSTSTSGGSSSSKFDVRSSGTPSRNVEAARSPQAASTPRTAVSVLDVFSPSRAVHGTDTMKTVGERGAQPPSAPIGLSRQASEPGDSQSKPKGNHCACAFVGGESNFLIVGCRIASLRIVRVGRACEATSCP